MNTITVHTGEDTRIIAPEFGSHSVKFEQNTTTNQNYAKTIVQNECVIILLYGIISICLFGYPSNSIDRNGVLK